MKFSHVVLSAVLAGGSFVAAPLAAGAAFSGADAPAVMRDVNRERTRAGLSALALDVRLCAIAQAYAEDMSRRHYFSHVTPEGVDPFARLRRARVRFRTAGEDLGLAESASRAQTLIWNDPPHRKVILMRAYRKLGVGTARTAQGTILVEDFTD
jgi:uncharacterized protein YkwD